MEDRVVVGSNMIHNTIQQLAIKLPGGNEVKGPSELTSSPRSFTDLSSFISPLLNIIFFIAVFWAFYYLVWGAFQYIVAGGKKEELAKARSRITWALIGLIIIFLAFFVAKFVSEIFPPGKGGLPF